MSFSKEDVKELISANLNIKNEVECINCKTQ